MFASSVAGISELLRHGPDNKRGSLDMVACAHRRIGCIEKDNAASQQRDGLHVYNQSVITSWNTDSFKA